MAHGSASFDEVTHTNILRRLATVRSLHQRVRHYARGQQVDDEAEAKVHSPDFEEYSLLAKYVFAGHLTNTMLARGTSGVVDGPMGRVLSSKDFTHPRMDLLIKAYAMQYKEAGNLHRRTGPRASCIRSLPNATGIINETNNLIANGNIAEKAIENPDADTLAQGLWSYVVQEHIYDLLVAPHPELVSTWEVRLTALASNPIPPSEESSTWFKTFIITSATILMQSDIRKLLLEHIERARKQGSGFGASN